MIVVRISCQLGNQMFQYALYRKLISLGRKVKLDTSYYEKNENRGKFGLSVFNLKLNIASSAEIEYSRGNEVPSIIKILNFILRRNVKSVSEVGALDLAFNSDLLMIRHGYLNGYWQTERYFRDIRGILIKEFSFPMSTNIKNIEILTAIKSQNSVSVHVRRGDYVGSTHFPVLPVEYYLHAMKYFKTKLSSPKFFVFSDDIGWARDHLEAENTEFVSWNHNVENYVDMYLMTQCVHNIISNSSFSWWGAYLNVNPNKEVIAPPKWFNYINTPDIICRDWRVIDDIMI